MPGLFQALEIGKRALLANQYTLNTVGHNIANVNTPGYSRQRVLISSSNPMYTTSGAVGTGVDVRDVIQVRDMFLGQQYRDATKAAGRWEYREKALRNIESLFNEPSDNALGSQLNGLWDTFSVLASDDSGDPTIRKDVLANATTLVNGLNQLSRNLSDQRQSLNRDIDNITQDVNRMASEIARLNALIQRNQASGSGANDLRDARDLIVDQLSILVDVNTVEKPNGGNMVQIGAMVLVDGDSSYNVGTKESKVAGRVTNVLVWEGTSVSIKNLKGRLAGLVETRDELLPGYMDQLDELARTLVDEVNAVHSSGYGIDGSTGVNFFDPGNVTAATIRLNTELLGSGWEKIAASNSATGRGDTSNALALSDLRNQSVAAEGTMTITDFYNSLVGKLGVETQEAISSTANYALLINQVDNARQSVQGVSLDEEMANMIKYQHAYEAAARVITAMDQALDTVIKGMGVVGR